MHKWKSTYSTDKQESEYNNTCFSYIDMATDDTESNEYIKQSSYDETEIVNVVEEALLKLSTSNSHKNKKVIILTR